MPPQLHVLDVQEKEVGAVRPPSFPSLKSPISGFPLPKMRSRFATNAARQRKIATDTETKAATVKGTERSTIDYENRQRIQNMGASEIAEARKELMTNLDPALLQILLRRANLDDSNGPLPSGPGEAILSRPPEINIKDTGSEDQGMREKDQDIKKNVLGKKSVSFAEQPTKDIAQAVRDGDALLLEARSATDLFPLTTPEAAIRSGATDSTHSHEHILGNNNHDHDHDHDHTTTLHSHSASMHFPQKPTIPDLDPADPNFLQNLHSKYFPNLPADPARLAWMAPLPTTDSPADRESPYYPGQATVAVSQLRFDFRGRLVSPRASRIIPVSKGLHHHGEAPEAAGYTVAELARLARSAVPAQRCVAFQTLGRMLYRLGRGEWGQAGADIDKDPRAAIAQGLWRCIQEGRVLDTLQEAAAVEEGRGHRGSRAYAIEAIWLFEKGGWKERWKGR